MKFEHARPENGCVINVTMHRNINKASLSLTIHPDTSRAPGFDALEDALATLWWITVFFKDIGIVSAELTTACFAPHPKHVFCNEAFHIVVTKFVNKYVVPMISIVSTKQAVKVDGQSMFPRVHFTVA